ncbi:MAG: VIT1/CCC1 transporter family protein [Spirochaetes bacterium]|nr:VIT1/CCC1 transporter family protein [Spirochaetota bacterium]
MTDAKLKSVLERFQENEITEHIIYARLSRAQKDVRNREVLERISADEYRHYQFWKGFTGTEVKPNQWKIFKYYWISRILGITFGLKLMERGEEGAEASYEKILPVIPEAEAVYRDEEVHENALMGMIEEERLQYVGSIVLGLNDALVELTGTLAGLTFALSNNRIVALAGLVTGIAASFSMAASEYLSTKAESDHARAMKSAVYTGIAYVFTVLCLILPYFILSSPFGSLGATLGVAVLIIFLFNYYVSVARNMDFRKRFLEMTAISLGVATVSFLIGRGLGHLLGVDVK